MKVQVLGSGCPTCKKLYEIAQQAVAGMDADIKLEYVTGVEGMGRIIELGGMSSPVVAVGDTIVMTGFSADIAKIQTAIRNAAEEA